MDAFWARLVGLDWRALVLAGAVLLVLLLGALSVYGVLTVRIQASGGRRVRCEGYGPVEFGVAAALVSWFVFLLAGAVSGGVGEPARIDPRILLMNAALPLALCLVVAIVLKVRRQSLSELFGWESMRCGRALILGAGLLAAAYPILLVLAVTNLMLIGGDAKPQSLVSFMRETDDATLRGAVIVLAVVFAPLCEEFLFRGFIYGVAKRYFGLWPALGLSSVLFAAIHLHPPSALPLAGFAVCLGLAYEASGTLLVPMTMHALFNAVSLAALLLFPEMT